MSGQQPDFWQACCWRPWYGAASVPDQAIRQVGIGFVNIGDVFGYTFALYLFHGNRIIVRLASAAIARSFIGGCNISRIDKAFFNSQIAAVIDIEENSATCFIVIAMDGYCIDSIKAVISS